MGSFQIDTMTSQVTKESLHPTAFPVQAEGPAPSRVVGEEESGFLIACLPEGQQLDPAEVVRPDPAHPTQIPVLTRLI